MKTAFFFIWKQLSDMRIHMHPNTQNSVVCLRLTQTFFGEIFLYAILKHMVLWFAECELMFSLCQDRERLRRKRQKRSSRPLKVGIPWALKHPFIWKARDRVTVMTCFLVQRHTVVDTFFGYDEESMDSETSSLASFRTDRTPATPDEDPEEVNQPIPA